MPADRRASPGSRVRSVLARDGLLLLHDGARPSLTALVAGAPIRGSWWGHRAGKDIFQVASALEEDGAALFVPLLEGKVTLVDPALWSALAAVGEAQEAWQLDRLDRSARGLLAEVEREGRLRASGAPARALAQALLVRAAQVHTERGAHATELQTWAAFRRLYRLGRRGRAPEARKALEAAANRWLGSSAGAILLPWKQRRAKGIS